MFRVACLAALLAVSVYSQSTSFRDAGVAEHNRLRAKHGGPNVAGDAGLHASAQKWADYLAQNNKFQHSGGPNGENIYKSWGSSTDLTKAVKDALTSWYGEIKDYNFNKPGYSSATGHFTQVVWKASTQVGIGAALANDPKYGHSITVVGQYNPRGNVITSDGSSFKKNVVPPK